eukprot:m.427496 g.427496  ORF g.427496 m.427496 type:complete len:899 (+) comp16864_c3_seq19:6058-8754(+)
MNVAYWKEWVASHAVTVCIVFLGASLSFAVYDVLGESFPVQPAAMSAADVQDWFQTHDGGRWKTYAPAFVDVDGKRLSQHTEQQFHDKIVAADSKVATAIYTEWHARDTQAKLSMSATEVQEWFRTLEGGMWSKYAVNFADLTGKILNDMTKEDFVRLVPDRGFVIYNDWAGYRPVTASLNASAVAHWVSTLSDGKWASYAPLFLDLDGSAFNSLTLDQLEAFLQTRADKDTATVYNDWRMVVNAANWPAAVVKHPCGGGAVVLCGLVWLFFWVRRKLILTTSLRLYDEDGVPLSQTSMLSEGDIVLLKGRDYNRRDSMFAPSDGRLFITTGTAQLLQEFWDEYRSALPVTEWCIGGASGSGKSCAAQILAADVVRKIPDAQVYYYRTWNGTDEQHVFSIVKESARTKPTFLFVDQLVNNKHAQVLGVLADVLNVWVVMIASANLSHFLENRQGGQHEKRALWFNFSSTAADCTRLARMWDVSQNTSFVPRTTIIMQDADTPHPKNFDELCTWTNGHLLSLATVLSKHKTVDQLLEEVADRMVAYHANHVEWYLAVIKMFKPNSLSEEPNSLSEAQIVKTFDLDLRYVGEEGHVLCPFFLQALQRSVALGPPPPTAYSQTYTHLHTQNPSEFGFAVERQALAKEKLSIAWEACLKELGHTFRIQKTERIGYRSFDQIVHQATQMPSTADWAIHAIPLKWNEKSIDAILLYFVDKVLYLIGNSISVSTAQAHSKSLAWIGELDGMRSALDMFDNIEPVLLFTGKQSDDSSELRVRNEFVNSAEAAGCTLMDYPLLNVVDTSAAHYLRWDLDMKTYGARVLKLVAPPPRKALGCRCTTGCLNLCGCFKAGNTCSACFTVHFALHFTFANCFFLTRSCTQLEYSTLLKCHYFLLSGDITCN